MSVTCLAPIHDAGVRINLISRSNQGDMASCPRATGSPRNRMLKRQGHSTIPLSAEDQAARKASGSIAACLRMALSVPSGMSPG
jgi:hypothetical protein